MTQHNTSGQVHIRYEGHSYDASFDDLDIGALSSEAEVRQAVARHLEAPPQKLAAFSVDKNEESGDITLRPQAVFGN
jgi:hypothetical protein